MISLILPFWQRQAAAEEALKRISELYRGLDLEVIVVDDGSPTPFKPVAVDVDLRVLYLPRKTEPKNPCVPLNAGVAESSGEYVAISCVEMIHRTALLEEMRREIETRGSKTYVTAACATEGGGWHAHSKHFPARGEGVALPARAHFHFLAMMRRDLWNEIGGFDEAYRDGAGYEDNDFVLTAAKAGAEFLMRDDLVVEHRRSGARAAWRPEMFARNREIYLRKWASATS